MANVKNEGGSHCVAGSSNTLENEAGVQYRWRSNNTGVRCLYMKSNPVAIVRSSLWPTEGVQSQ